MSAEETIRIGDLIARLVDIDHPDYGLCKTLGGHVFSPIPGTERFTAGLFADHGLRPCDTLRELVSYGSKALPFLLAAITDPTPTKLDVGQMLGQWFGHEVECNLANPFERSSLTMWQPRRGSDSHGMYGREFEGDYRLKVGDVCFVALGQILGRKYMAVRYKPTMCVVVNSAIENPQLAQQLRATWLNDRPAHHLFESLLADFRTEPDDSGDIPAIHAAASFREQAAMRLLFYFPDESASLVAERLREMPSQAPAQPVVMRNEQGATSEITLEIWDGIWNSKRNPSAF